MSVFTPNQHQLETDYLPCIAIVVIVVVVVVFCPGSTLALLGSHSYFSDRTSQRGQGFSLLICRSSPGIKNKNLAKNWDQTKTHPFRLVIGSNSPKVHKKNTRIGPTQIRPLGCEYCMLQLSLKLFFRPKIWSTPN